MTGRSFISSMKNEQIRIVNHVSNTNKIDEKIKTDKTNFNLNLLHPNVLLQITSFCEFFEAIQFVSLVSKTIRKKCFNKCSLPLPKFTKFTYPEKNVEEYIILCEEQGIVTDLPTNIFSKLNLPKI